MSVFIEYLPSLRQVHLFAVLFSLLIAAMADLRALKMVFKPLDTSEVHRLGQFHMLLIGGLVLLWATGLILMYELTQFQLEKFSPKLIAKISVVLILTVNASVIGKIAFGAMVKFPNTILGAIPLSQRIKLCIMSLISFVSWVSATVLGAIPVFKPMGATQLTEIFGGAYMFAIVAGVLMSLMCGLIAGALARRLSGKGNGRDAIGSQTAIAAE